MDILNMTKAQAIAQFKKMLAENEAWALKGLLTIYQFQTDEEQMRGATHEFNGVGFNGTDSVILSSFAQQINAGRKLSPRQMAVVFKCMPKYAGQLYRVALAKAQAEAAKKITVVEKPVDENTPPVKQSATRNFKLVFHLVLLCLRLYF